MKFDSGRPWLWAAMAVLAIIIVIWIVAALQLNTASASALPFPSSRPSNLSADYSSTYSENSGLLGFLSLTVLADAFRDEGLTDEEAEVQSEAIRDTLEGEVPTATALNFSGDSPFTPTVTFTSLPTGTAPPTRTNTPPPSSTARPASTSTDPPPAPSKTPTSAGGSPTSTPEPTAPPDTQDPIVVAGAAFSPPPPDLSACVISVSGQQVLDPAPSSGMDRVRLKYTGPGIPGYLYSGDLIPVGGFSGGGWDAVYSGSVNVSGNGFVIDDQVELWVMARDNAGNESFIFIDNYLLLSDCP